MSVLTWLGIPEGMGGGGGMLPQGPPEGGKAHGCVSLGLARGLLPGCCHSMLLELPAMLCEQ